MLFFYWWHRVGTPGSLQEVAQAAGWKSAEHPGQWVPITRTFRDGSTQDWWALEIVAGPYGSDKTERAVVATTDPQTLPDLTTWYLVTNLPAPTTCPVTAQQLAPANLEEVIRLYGLRMWVEQSYKQVKHALGWSQYQVRSDQAIRRHWQLVCCAFSFCWYHASHPFSSTTEDAREASEPPASHELEAAVDVITTGKKNQGWSPGSCCGESFERGQSSPHHLFSSACLISLGRDRGSSSLARSEWCSFPFFASSPAHGSPGSSKLGSRACHARLPTTGNSLGFLASGCASSNAFTPICKAAPFFEGRPGMGRGRTVPVSRLCFT